MDDFDPLNLTTSLSQSQSITYTDSIINTFTSLNIIFQRMITLTSEYEKISNHSNNLNQKKLISFDLVLKEFMNAFQEKFRSLNEEIFEGFMKMINDSIQDENLKIFINNFDLEFTEKMARKVSKSTSNAKFKNMVDLETKMNRFLELNLKKKIKINTIVARDSSEKIKLKNILNHKKATPDSSSLRRFSYKKNLQERFSILSNSLNGAKNFRSSRVSHIAGNNNVNVKISQNFKNGKNARNSDWVRSSLKASVKTRKEKFFDVIKNGEGKQGNKDFN